jgi:hypothetical protein
VCSVNFHSCYLAPMRRCEDAQGGVREMKRFSQGWRNAARKAGNFQARIFLVIFYFTLATPVGFGTRWFLDPLHIKTASRVPAWGRRDRRGSDPAEMRRQY